jgi:hypothetical protein
MGITAIVIEVILWQASLMDGDRVRENVFFMRSDLFDPKRIESLQ